MSLFWLHLSLYACSLFHKSGRAGGGTIVASAAPFWGCRATCKHLFIPGAAMLQHMPRLSKNVARGTKNTKKSAMLRFTMLCYALGHPWVALGTYLGWYRTHFGRFWEPKWDPWAHLCHFGEPKWGPWAPLGSPGDLLGMITRKLIAFWWIFEHFWRLLGAKMEPETDKKGYTKSTLKISWILSTKFMNLGRRWGGSMWDFIVNTDVLSRSHCLAKLMKSNEISSFLAQFWCYF